MSPSKIYCSKCVASSSHHIARGKLDADVFRQVTVVAQNKNGSYRCSCNRCGHAWNSRSPEAAALLVTGAA